MQCPLCNACVKPYLKLEYSRYSSYRHPLFHASLGTWSSYFIEDLCTDKKSPGAPNVVNNTYFGEYLLWGLKYVDMTYFGLFGSPERRLQTTAAPFRSRQMLFCHKNCHQVLEMQEFHTLTVQVPMQTVYINSVYMYICTYKSIRVYMKRERCIYIYMHISIYTYLYMPKATITIPSVETFHTSYLGIWTLPARKRTKNPASARAGALQDTTPLSFTAKLPGRQLRPARLLPPQLHFALA